jgi:hypothetical protein
MIQTFSSPVARGAQFVAQYAGELLSATRRTHALHPISIVSQSHLSMAQCSLVRAPASAILTVCH